MKIVVDTREQKNKLNNFKGKNPKKGDKLSQEMLDKIKKTALKGKNHPMWKGGRRKRSDGYIEIYMPEHPNCQKSRKTVFEHHLVMEKSIGRYLTENEIVHHINGIRNDNRIENLKLMNKSSHCKLHLNDIEEHTCIPKKNKGPNNNYVCSICKRFMK